MLRRACLLSALFALVAAAPAAATNYCVPSGPAGCTAEGGVQAALTAAQNSPGADTVTIASGTYVPAANCSSGGFTYNGTPTNTVAITGAGSGQTILTCPENYNNGGSYLRILGLSGAGSTLSGVGIHLPAGHYDRGLELDGASADHIDVSCDPAADKSAIGVVMVGGALTNSSVADSMTDNGEAVSASHGVTIDRDTLASGGIAADVSTTPLSVVSRSVITANDDGIKLDNDGQVGVYDTAIDLTGQGFYVSGLDANVVGDAGNSLTARNVSITSTGPNAVGVAAAATGSGVTLAVSVTDSVIWGPAIGFSRTATTGSANLTAAYDDYPAGGYAGTGPGSTVETNALHVDPHFAGATDLHIGAGSPLIDAGTGGSVSGGEPATDLDGNARILDGNGDCTANRDIGAYEYVAPLKVTASGTPASVNAGQAISFHAAGCGIDASLAAPSYTWSFDDGTTGSGGTVSHAFLTAGSHTATATAHDTAGHTGTSTTTVVVSPRAITTTTTTTSTHTLTAPTPTPVLSRLRLSATRFRLHQPRHGRRVTLGTAIKWTDTLAGTTTLTVTASARGITSGKRCVPVPRRRPRHAHGCTRTVTLGAVTHHDRAGVNALTFGGRVGRHVLAAGRYRLTLVARLGRRASRPASATFTVTG